MTDQTGRPDDETRPDGTTPHPERSPGRDEATPESVLTGFSWDDPSGAAPRRPEDDPSGAAPRRPEGDPQGSATDPPAAPYPPAAVPYAQTSPGQQTGAPYGQPSPPYGQPSPPYGEPSPPYGQPSSPYGQPSPPYGQPYGQAPAPYPTQSGGYGQSAEYTSTPQPYAYGPPPLSPEADSVRSKAILWTILNSASLLLGFFVLVVNIPSLVGLILGAMAIGRTRTDLDGASGLVRWSWILFVIGIVVAVIWWIVIFAMFASLVAGTPGLLGEFTSP